MFRCYRRSTPAGIWRSPHGRCPRTRCPTWPAATPPARGRSTASTRKPPTNSSRRRPRRRSRHRQRLTRPATGNRPSPGAAPTKPISAESTAPWTKRTAEQPTSTAESWRCSPTNEQQPAILINVRFCPGDPGCSGYRLTCPPPEVRNPQHGPSKTVVTGAGGASIAVKSSARCPGCPPITGEHCGRVYRDGRTGVRVDQQRRLRRFSPEGSSTGRQSDRW